MGEHMGMISRITIGFLNILLGSPRQPTPQAHEQPIRLPLQVCNGCGCKAFTEEEAGRMFGFRTFQRKKLGPRVAIQTWCKSCRGRMGHKKDRQGTT